jgi:diguanylate cyclase (GGDEF)-like protein/PAS domain S-box-containing protein
VLEPVRSPDGSVDDFTVVADSGMTAELAGRSSVGRTLRDLMPGPFADRLVALNREVLTSGRTTRHEMALQEGPDGSPLPVDVPLDPPLGPGPRDGERRRLGEVVRVPVDGRVVVMWRDVTEARAAQRELRTTETRFRRLVEHASDPILVTRADRTITYVSPAVGELLHLDTEAIIGTRFGGYFVSPEDTAIGLDLYERVLALPPGGSARAVVQLVDGDGRTRWVSFVATNWLDDPVVDGIVLNSHDVTEQHEGQQRLRQQALTDDLTGLPNRRWFTDALHRAIERSRRARSPFALLLLDVDNFKVLNDSLGHSAGDRLLVELSRRISGVLGPGESVARLGGDEFVVLVEDLEDVPDAVRAATRIADVARARHTVGSLATQVTLSIGVATSEPGATGVEVAGGGAESLLAHADAALYEAKRRGRNRIELFEGQLRARLLHRLHLESQLLHALEHDELLLHWQPIVPVRAGRPPAVEALLRWQHPQRGLLPAAEFLPVATEVGLMPQLCLYAVDAAMAQAARWHAAGDGPDVFINLAAVQLSRPSLAEELAESAARHGVTPERLQFEVAEDVLGVDVSRLSEQLTRMREHGFRIALDDFGAGNTALTWLRRLPVDTLKLDKDFATNLDEGPTRTVVRSVVRLAADLGIATVAEGVETGEQLDFFTDAGCDFTQGYLHARPQAARALGWDEPEVASGRAVG